MRFFEETLACLRDDYAGVGMLMMVDSEELWDTWGQESLERLRRYKEQGRIDYIGMSGHKAATALKAVESGRIDVLMYPVNLAARTIEGNDEVYRACARENVGLVAMKPYARGVFFLADQLVLLHWVQQRSATGRRRMRKRTTGRSSRTSTTTRRGSASSATAACPAPRGLTSPRRSGLVDMAQDGVTDELAAAYTASAAKPSACVECGDCMERCPYEVDVLAKMRMAVTLFEATG